MPILQQTQKAHLQLNQNLVSARVGVTSTSSKPLGTINEKGAKKSGMKLSHLMYNPIDDLSKEQDALVKAREMREVEILKNFADDAGP